MKSRVAILYSFFLLFGVHSVLANTKKDTSASLFKHNVTLICNEQALAPYNLWHKQIWTTDTMLNNLERFVSHYNLGNTGLPCVPVIFNNSTPPLGFFYGHDYLSDYYIYTDTSIRYYNTRAPYTSFYYVTDPQIHQMLHLYHTQNIGQKLNLAFEFHRIRSQGDYLNEGTNLNQVAITANYRSKRYVMLANVQYDMLKFQQNGGIVADTDLTNSNFSNRQTIPIYLSNANTIMLEKSFHLQHYFYFGYKSDDTLHNYPAFYISHSLRIAGHSNVFNDAGTTPNKAFYSNFFLDSTRTYDSLRYNEFTNDVSIGGGQRWNSLLKWEAGVKDQWVHFSDFVTWQQTTGTSTTNYTNKYSDSIFSNLIAHARLYNMFTNDKFYFDVEGEYIFSGNQKGDMKGMAELGMKIDSLRTLNIKGNYAAQSPDVIYQLYNGNNFSWRNNFKRTNTSSLSLTYLDGWWHFSLTLEAAQINNLTYFNSAALPAQYDSGTIQVFSIHFTKEFTLGKWHLNTNETYQMAPDNVPLHLPQIVAENSIFYQNFLFHNALLLKAGVDVFYNTSYYAYAYMPVFDQYYIQNQRKLGDYVYFDPFISFRVKTFRMFLKMENVGSGLLQKGTFYGYALHYPMNDRVLRFGISWDFWN